MFTDSKQTLIQFKDGKLTKVMNKHHMLGSIDFTAALASIS